METPDPFTRQRRLREVGDAGQARISEAKYAIASGESSAFEFAYLHRAGAASIEVRPEHPRERFMHETVFRHGAPRAVAEGAWNALRKLRKTLGLESK